MPTTDEQNYRQDWMSADQWRCAQLAAEYKGGFHHLTNLRKWASGVAIDEPNEIATYDFDGLTRLVVMAHDDAVRIGAKIVTTQETYEGHDYETSTMVISFHPREKPQPGMKNWQMHPELDEAIANIRAARS